MMAGTELIVKLLVKDFLREYNGGDGDYSYACNFLRRRFFCGWLLSQGPQSRTGTSEVVRCHCTYTANVVRMCNIYVY